MNEKTDIEIKTLIPFGPIMLHTKIPQYVIDNYNKHCDEIIADKKKLKNQDHSHNLAGNVKCEFRIEKEFIEEEKNMQQIINAMAKHMLSAEP